MGGEVQGGGDEFVGGAGAGLEIEDQLDGAELAGAVNVVDHLAVCPGEGGAVRAAPLETVIVSRRCPTRCVSR